MHYRRDILTVAGLLAAVACGDTAPLVVEPTTAATSLAITRTADVRAGAGSGAVIFIDLAGSCGMFDGNGNVVYPLDNQVTLHTPSGSALANCFAQVDNPTGRAIRWDAVNNPLGLPPFPCIIFDGKGGFVETFFLHETISASGQAHLICVLNGSPKAQAP